MGTKGIKPKMQKLKNVMIEFLIGFYSPEMSCNSYIIITLRKPSLFSARMPTIYYATVFSKPRWV
jgi:hypothetical protein